MYENKRNDPKTNHWETIVVTTGMDRHAVFLLVDDNDTLVIVYENKRNERSLIQPTVTYECEAWALTNADEQQLRIFERNILR